MAEDNKAKTDYSSNSFKSKQEGSPGARPEVKQITSGRVQKKSLGAKFKETFAGDDASSVGQYVFFDVIIPRTKDLLFDMISQGFERLLFGSSTPSRRKSSGSILTGRTDYRGISNQTEPAHKEYSRVARANHNFEDIRIDTRSEAESVLDTLMELVDQYESATVADLYMCVGISTDHTDLKFGWTDLSDARIHAARGGGYILEMPRVEVL